MANIQNDWDEVTDDILMAVHSMKHEQLWKYIETNFPNKYKSPKEFLRMKLIDEVFTHKLEKYGEEN
tara:strand:- start:291 stop:491 length:201 start_codon:yes stop_codon:yes gene_type:complete